MALGRYLIKRGAFLFATLVLAIYVTVVIANYGGVIDELLRQQLRSEVITQFRQDPNFSRLPLEEQARLINATWQRRVELRGLNEPFLPKSIRYTVDALFLNLGDAQVLSSNAGSREIFDILMERLPRTLVLFFTGDIIAAALGIWLGLRMARKAMSKMDRGLTVLSITTLVVPPWVFGIFFILFFAYGVDLTPAGGYLSVPPPAELLPLIGDFLYHLALPLGTVVFAFFGGWAYTTRNLTLQIMDEDFVWAGRAKGLPERTVMRRYVLRAASPPIATALALTLIASWFGAIITETVFNWPGIGLLYWEAIMVFDAPVIIGLTALYAMILVATVFVLDLTYGFLDPRVRAMRGS
ncbi:MAG: ABC transporter permease [Candidatus Thermoplasmatota archaeon]|nr:ABC transporter permease [Candidatus Thermoplasmatota archaeon]